MENLFAERYRIERELGRGSFGVVFLGYDTRLSDRPVAIKILHPALNQDPAVIRRFHQEAGILARLDHDYIVPVYDVSASGERRFIVMRYIPGPTLARILDEEGPQPPERVFAWLQQMAAGLDYAHSKGVLHRDMKPSNLLWDEERERVLISDFGLARAVQASGGSSVSQSQAEMTGTAYYMAPEIIRGQKHTAASDLYSLGCVLYELLTGRPPFEGENVIAITSQHVLEPVPQLALQGDLGVALAEQVAALMAKEPDARPGSAGEVVAQVQAGMAEKEAARRAEAERQAAEAAAAERAQREAEEKARLAALEKERREKEAAEAERQRQEAKRKKRQEEERRRAAAARAAELELLRKKQADREEAREKKPAARWLVAVLLLAILATGGFFAMRAMQPHPTPEVIVVTATPTAQSVAASATSPSTPTVTPPTATPRPPADTPLPSTNTPTAPTDTPASTTSLGVGSTMIWEKDGMEMVYVPAGEFLMGSPDGEGEDDEHPQHTVYLDAFWIDKTEVTNAMFAKFVESESYQSTVEKSGCGWVYLPEKKDWNCVSGADWRHPRGPDSDLSGLDSHPVVQVSWFDAKAYCQWAGKRLTTEAEWEKAARGTDGRTYPWGNEWDVHTTKRLNFTDKNINFDWSDKEADDGYQYTAPVGSYPAGASPYGALDMAGNVWEWVADWYDGNYYANSPSRNPTGPDSGDARVLRGGSWFNFGYFVRAAFRVRDVPDIRGDFVGFRCLAPSP